MQALNHSDNHLILQFDLDLLTRLRPLYLHAAPHYALLYMHSFASLFIPLHSTDLYHFTV